MFPIFIIFISLFSKVISANKETDLLDWAKENGVKINKIELQNISENNRGFFALEDINDG